MNCPHCGSDNTRKHSIIYQEGTSHGKGEASSWGGAKYTTEHLSQTPLAQRCSPPERPGIGKLLSFLGILFSAWVAYQVVILFRVPPERSWWVKAGAFFSSLALLRIFWSFVFGRHRKARYDELYAAWEKSWVCVKCGESFVEK